MLAHQERVVRARNTALAVSGDVDPDEVAKVVVECVQGEREADRGRTILLPSP